MVFWDKIAGLYDVAQSLNGKVRREMVRLAAELIPEGATVIHGGDVLVLNEAGT